MKLDTYLNYGGNCAQAFRFYELGRKYLTRQKGVDIPVQIITPHLWFDKEAKEAAEFYTSTFKDSKVKNTATLHNTPSGTVNVLTIELLGQDFTLINAGPLFKFTPAVSFLVACRTKEEVDALWNELSQGGSALMELGEYPFSERYGWTQDRYGLSWQVMFMGNRAIEQRITPTLMFVGEQCGRAEEAINFYSSVFHDAKVDHILRYGKDDKPDKEGTISMPTFRLKVRTLPSWTALAHTTSLSTRQFRSWCTAIPRNKSTTSGRSCRQSRRQKRADG
jgi:predicted 3-demethylubiquinone-9 3-methyltransferase (glyoxalase superfamily)